MRYMKGTVSNQQTKDTEKVSETDLKLKLITIVQQNKNNNDRCIILLFLQVLHLLCNILS